MKKIFLFIMAMALTKSALFAEVPDVTQTDCNASNATVSSNNVCLGGFYTLNYPVQDELIYFNVWQFAFEENRDYWYDFSDAHYGPITLSTIGLSPGFKILFRVKSTKGSDELTCVSYSNELLITITDAVQPTAAAGVANISSEITCWFSPFTLSYSGSEAGAMWETYHDEDKKGWIDNRPWDSGPYHGWLPLVPADKGPVTFAGGFPLTTVNGLGGDRFRVSVPDGDCYRISNEVAIAYFPRVEPIITGPRQACASSGNIELSVADAGTASYTSIVWSPGGATTPSISVNPQVSTLYRVTVTDINGCTASTARFVEVPPPPTAGTAIISAAAVCAGSEFSLEIVGASNINGLSYWEYYYEADGTWRYAALSNDIVYIIALNPATTVNGLPGDKFRVHHTNNCGEDRFSNEVSIIYAPYPEVNITAIPENITYTSNNPNTFYLGNGPQRITLQSSVTGDIGNGFNYNWTGTGLSCTNCASPVFEPTKPGNYTFTLTASTLLSNSATGNNNALILNGIDNYVEDNSVVIDPSLGFTVEGWINMNSLDALNGLAAKTLNNIPAPFDVYITYDGTVNFFAGDGNNFFYATSTTMLTPGEWNHIACVYHPASSEIRIYINGQFEGSSAVDNNLIADNGTSFRIGSRSDDAYFTNGKEDEIRVWNVARNTQQINAGMNTSVPANSAGLTAYYKLDENAGTSVLESVSNTNRGILKGSSANWEVPTTAPVQPEGLCPTTKSITINVINAIFCITTNINETICPGGSINMLAGGPDVVNCTSIGKRKLRFSSPAGFDFNIGYALFGPDLESTPLTGDVVYLPDITGSFTGCSAYPAGSLTGKIALIERSIQGNPFCSAFEKTLNAQQAGAIGVILIFNQPCVAGNTFGAFYSDFTPADPSLITIPFVAVGPADGEKIKCWINSPTITNISWSPGTGLNTTTGSSVIATPATTTTYTASYIYGNGSSGSLSKTITVAPPEINIRIWSNPDDLYTGGNPNNIYLGYGPQKISLFVTSTFDFCGGMFTWTGAGLSSIFGGSCDFEPPGPGNYTITVTATSVAGCVVTKSITICVKDVRVPGKKTQVYICHNSSKGSNTIILNPQDVPAHLAHGDALGQCGQGCGTNVSIASKSTSLAIDQEVAGIMVYPNPAKNSVTVSFNAEKTDKYQLLVTDIAGRAVLTKSDNAIKGNNKVQVNLTGIANGTYLIIVKKGHETLHTRIVKQ